MFLFVCSPLFGLFGQFKLHKELIQTSAS